MWLFDRIFACMRKETGLPFGLKIQIIGSELGLLAAYDHNSLVTICGLTLAFVGAIATIDSVRRSADRQVQDREDEFGNE